MAVQDKDKLVSLEDLKTVYDDLDGDVSDLKNSLAISYKTTGFTDNRYINYVTGKRQIASSDINKSASGFISIPNGTKALVITRLAHASSYTGAHGLAFYSELSEESFIQGSGVKESSSSKITTDSIQVERISVPENATYFRTTWIATTHELYPSSHFYCLFEKEEAYVLLDAFTEMSETFTDMQLSISEMSETLTDVESMTGTETDISNSFDFIDGKRINYVTGVYQNGPGRSATQDFVNIEGYDSLRITRRISEASEAYNADGLAFYSEADASTFISPGSKAPYDPELDEPSVGTYFIDIPSTAKYIRTTWFASSAGKVFSCYGIKYGLLSQSIGELSQSVDNLSESVNTICNNVDPDILLPEYYNTNSYIDGRITAIIEKIKASSINGDCFFWFTDPHFFWWTTPSVYNGLNSIKLINYIKKRVNIKKVFCGGDLVGGTGMTPDVCTRNLMKVREHLNSIWPDLYMILGNHEYNNPNDAPETAMNQLYSNQLYKMLIKDKEDSFGSFNEYGDYWFDNAVQKIRYFCIGANVRALLEDGQVTWFANEMLNLPNGYTVVVLSHIGLSKNSTIPTAENTFRNIVDVMDAVKLKTSVTVKGQIYNYSQVDVTVACGITGHNHQDINTTTPNGIPIISTTCDRGPTNSSDENFNAAREYGTINEQAIDVVQIDTENKKIYMTRIGGSFDGTAPLQNPDREFDYT